MRSRGAIVAFVLMASVATVAGAETKFISVPAGDLTAGLESLAKQCGVDVIYPSAPLKGRATPGVAGTLEPMEAFRKLIGDAPFELKEEGGALLITQVSGAQLTQAAGVPPSPATSQSGEEPISEVEVQAARAEKLSALRAEIVKLENEFYDEYNKLNAERDFDVECTMEPPTGSHVPVRSCQPAFVTKALRDLAWNGFAPPPVMMIRLNTPGYQKNMVTLVSQHRQLLELLKERSALVERYEVVRKRKGDEKTFAWD